MADIRLDLSGSLTDGQIVTFKAPCDCTAIEGLKVYYINNGNRVSKKFKMKDSHGNDLANIGNLFAKGAYIQAILDTNNSFAYLQNADTNGYLEEKLVYIGDGIPKIVFATEEPSTVPENTIVMVYEE